MKKKDKNQVRTLSTTELRKEILDTGKKLSDRLVGKKGSVTRNTREGKTLRTKRAVMLTILREKELVT